MYIPGFNSAEFYVGSPKACWFVPFQRNPRFVGRISEVTKIESILSLENRCERVAITGLGGVGKTQISLEFAYQLRQKYSDCSVFWIPAMNVEGMREAYLEIGRQLGIPNAEKEKADIKKLVQHHLSHESAGKWLLVFDNADDIGMWIDIDSNAAQSWRLIDYLPKSSHGSIVFTTRSLKTAVKLAGNNVIQVEEMDESVGKLLLSKSLINQSLLTDHMAKL